MKKILLAACAALLAFMPACTEDDPTGNPGEVLAASEEMFTDQYFSASVTGSVYGEGITDRGFVWGTGEWPTLEDSSASDEGTGAGTFSMQLTGLQAGTTYHVRTYAVGAGGAVSYGSPRSLTTVKSLTTSITGVSPELTMIRVNADVANGLENLVITERGVCYGTSPDPRVDGVKVKAAAGGKGTFTVDITGLDMNTFYYVCSYAVSTEGTIYSYARITRTMEPTPAFFRSVLQAAGAYTGIVRNAEGGFVARYAFDIASDTDPAQSKVKVTYLSPDFPNNATHVTLPVTFDEGYEQASWDAVTTMDGSSFGGVSRNGADIASLDGSGLTLDKPFPTGEIAKMFISTDAGGYGRCSEAREAHVSVESIWSAGILLLEINGGFNALMTQWQDQFGAEWMCYGFAEVPPAVSGDKITFRFAGDYFWDEENENTAARRDQAWTVCTPFLSMLLFNPEGCYIVSEKPLTGSVENGDFNYYMISSNGAQWQKWYFRLIGT